MSSSEDDFQMDVDDSASEPEWTAPVAKKAKAAPADKAADKGKAKAKPAPKPKTASSSGAPAKPRAPAKKKAPLAPKNLPNDSISDAASDVDMSGGGGFGGDGDGDVTIDADAATKSRAKGAGEGPQKSASEMYQKLSQLEHILKRPDSYIGSVEHVSQPMWIFDRATKQMALKTISYVPGFFKIFDEILVNAADNKINDPSMDTFKVKIDRANNEISVYNNGKGIPIEMHSKEKIWIPEMIFGHLLTSSNYDDDQKKLTGGRNGYGAKLANIYSLEFTVETADKNTEQKYRQVFERNMSVKGKAKITSNKKGEEYTRITFRPDLARFGMTEIDDDTEALLMKRVYDMAGTVKDVKVFLNDERIKVKGFKQYIEMYVAAHQNTLAESSGGAALPKQAVVYETSKDGRWEIGFTLSDGQPAQVSFANSISTIKGGTHVDMVTTQIANKLGEQIKKKNKAAPIKPFQIKNHMWVFVNALVENPAFDSQTKDTLTLKSSAFGSKCDLSEDFVKKVAKSGIIENVLNWAKFKSDQLMKKTDGAKRSRISGIVKLEDANNAGGKKAKDCVLILTEGDSAKALAVSGLSVVGRDNYGVFPLRGKLLNVREAGHDSVMKNVEIQHIKQIMGLKHGHDYKSTENLRYGSLMIMTDQDHDGSHIKGLIINFLDTFYPSLLKIPGFLLEFITPIVKVWKGKQELTFYTMPEYEEWKEAHNNGKGWESKYYKGLGTSGPQDAKKYFSDLDRHMLPFQEVQPGDRELIDLAFNKKKADDRKEWLAQFKLGTYIDHDVKQIAMSDFINKELILFSMADNIRSIPSVADGLKPGQRKVLFGCFKRKLVKEIKVAQLAGYVSEKTAYHHGEVSLTQTIVGLAQTFVGSNNINLLEPNGQFGTRAQGGKDAASARYIFTNVPRMTRALFHPHDDPILNYQVEDDMGIEPEMYLPVVPLVLIDGADGIGTGWSTSIPNYNPVDIVDNIRRKMNDEPLVKMVPWFRGFKGSIEAVSSERYKVDGIIHKIDEHTVEITELPIRVWTQNYKETLEDWVNGTEKIEPRVKDYKEYHTDSTVHFVITLTEKQMKAAETEGLVKYFHLTGSIATSNMVCFDLNGKIRKYANPEQILEEFYDRRLEMYTLRKQNLADELTRQFDRVSNQARFVQMIISKELVVSNKKKADIESELRALKFKPFAKSKQAKDAGENEPTLEDEENDADGGQAGDFDYLLGMAIWSLTKEKVDRLLRERDEKEGELMALLKLTPKDIWNTDLDNFLAEWRLMLDSDVQASKRVKPKPKNGALLKRIKKKARGDDSDDSEEEQDWKPKAATKTKSTEKEAVARVAPVPKAAPTVPVKRPVADPDSDDEVIVKKPAVVKSKAAPAKPKPTVVKATLESSDDDDVYSIIKQAAPKPAAKKAPAKPAVVDLPSSDFESVSDAKSGASDLDWDRPPGESSIRKKAKTTPVKKQVAASKPADKEKAKLVTKDKKAAVPKAKPARKADSDFDDDDDSMGDLPTPPPRAAPARAAGRAAAAKAIAYVDFSDDE